MGIYASNNFNLTIPVAAIEAIFAEYQPVEYVYRPAASTTEPIAPSVEALVRVIADAFGNDDDLPDFTDDGSEVYIHGYSYGKLGDAQNLSPVLAEHGATGIVWGEADGEYFLEEFTDGLWKTHGGQVTYPSYTGTLYQP